MSLKKNMKILIIDDMPTIRLIIKKMLRDIGQTNFLEAGDGSLALPMIEDAIDENEPYDLIISDWNMPIMTGLELLQNLRGDLRFKKLPFLMITAENDSSHVVTAVKAGVSNFIIKPFSNSLFQEKINRIFKMNK